MPDAESLGLYLQTGPAASQDAQQAGRVARLALTAAAALGREEGPSWASSASQPTLQVPECCCTQMHGKWLAKLQP